MQAQIIPMRTIVLINYIMLINCILNYSNLLKFNILFYDEYNINATYVNIMIPIACTAIILIGYD